MESKFHINVGQCHNVFLWHSLDIQAYDSSLHCMDFQRLLSARVSTCLMYPAIFATVNHNNMYHKSSNISRTLAGNKSVDNSGVVGASPADAAPTKSTTYTRGFTVYPIILKHRRRPALIIKPILLTIVRATMMLLFDLNCWLWSAKIW